jgi:TRAP-type mannitol/chloroaromatic compound transport system permease small subunit
MGKLKSMMGMIDSITDFEGRVVAIWILPIMVIIVYEVVLRYFFKEPTIWVEELSRFIFTAYFILGGAYALYLRGHVIMDGIYRHLSVRTKAILDLGSALIFFFFMAILTWEGWEIFWNALTNMERTESSWAPLTFPLKVVLPIGCFLMLLQGLVKFIRDLRIAFTGSGAER